MKNDVDVLRRGDIIGINGFPCRTPAGEFSICARSITMLAPCLRKPVNPHVALGNVDKRYRNRHLDFLANPEKKDIFRIRALIIREIRNFFEEMRFLEVETPIVDYKFGGALARPFKTFHNDLGQDVYLRIAPEIPLKQLLISGFDRVYEIGKQFRNEGVDSTHNPEFSTCEFYMAYGDYYDAMSVTARWNLQFRLPKYLGCHGFFLL